MPVVHIEHDDDPRIAEYRNVPDRALLEHGGLFVAEGRLVVRRLLASSRMRARSVMVTDTARSSLADVLLPGSPLPVFVVPQAVMDAVTGFHLHRGCLAIGERPTPADWHALAAAARRLVVLERVGNADNIGAIFRNAAAFGVGAVLLGPGCGDPLYRKAIRTSMAAALGVPFATAEPWPGMLSELRDRGWVTVALTPSAEAPPLHAITARMTAPAPVALVLGHEGEGLTAAARNACEYCARIPMASGVDSLNVATAAAVASYEICARHATPDPIVFGRGSAR